MGIRWLRFTPDVGPLPSSVSTPDGQTAQDLYEKRLTWISEEMRASARDLGCTFHRAWHASDGSAFYALAHWRTLVDARTFFERWRIGDEQGEVAIMLEGDVGLVRLGGDDEGFA